MWIVKANDKQQTKGEKMKERKLHVIANELHSAMVTFDDWLDGEITTKQLNKLAPYIAVDLHRLAVVLKNDCPIHDSARQTWVA